MISASIVSHGQKDLVLDLFNDFKRLKPPLVTQITLTHNLIDDRRYFPDRIGHIAVTQIYRGKRLGFGANHNAAFTFSTQPFFGVLNPDLRLVSDPFPLLVQQLEAKSCGIVGPQVRNADNSVADSARALYTPASVFGALGGRSRLHPDKPAWIAGMFMLFKKQAFTEVMGFDERYFMYVEDVDICARMVLAGWQISYEPNSSVTHLAQFANRKSLRHIAWHIRSAVRWWSSTVYWRYLFALNRKAANESAPK